MLEYDSHLAEAVEEGRAAARRGELLEHDEVVQRIERVLLDAGKRLAEAGSTQPAPPWRTA